MRTDVDGDVQRAFVFRSVFEYAYNYMKSGQLIRQVINEIQDGVDFNKAQEPHLFGDISVAGAICCHSGRNQHSARATEIYIG